MRNDPNLSVRASLGVHDGRAYLLVAGAGRQLICADPEDIPLYEASVGG